MISISLNSQVPSNDDPTLADKEAILASLNIKAMTFGDIITNIDTSINVHDSHISDLSII